VSSQKAIPPKYGLTPQISPVLLEAIRARYNGIVDPVLPSAQVSTHDRAAGAGAAAGVEFSL
jgi:hypothetical protein